MIKVTPKVFLIAMTALEEGIADWMSHVGGVDCLHRARGMEAETLIELAARRCYKSFEPGLNLNVNKIRTDSEEYLANVLKQGHGSVLAHSSATFAFEDVSRVFTHELCRNQIGIKEKDSNEDLSVAEFGLSQESLRYVRLDQLRVWLPPEFEDDEFLRGETTAAIEYLEEMQKKIATHLRMDEMDFGKKKILTSALRRMLPMGIGTGIVWTANFRALRWVIQQRTDEAAEVEIRIVFDEVAKLLIARCPYIFGDFSPIEKKGINQWTPKYAKV